MEYEKKMLKVELAEFQELERQANADIDKNTRKFLFKLDYLFAQQGTTGASYAIYAAIREHALNELNSEYVHLSDGQIRVISK